MSQLATLDRLARQMLQERGVDLERYAKPRPQRGQRSLFGDDPGPKDPEFERLHPRDPDGTFTEKESWHLTRAEYHRAERDKPGYDVARTNRQYWQAVGRAIDRHDPVPDHVAAEYHKLFGDNPEPAQDKAALPKEPTSEARPQDLHPTPPRPAERLEGGAADGKPDSDFDPEALAKGVEHEQEHTRDPEVAKEIAKDHLTESPAQDYYDKLEQIEPDQENSTPEVEPSTTPHEPPEPDLPEVDDAEPPEPDQPDPDASPREQATLVTTEQLRDPDEYVYARKSAIGNVGKDIVGSARHRRNAWRGLEDAERNGTAAELVTREKLLKNEPLELSAHVTKNPLTTLVMHYAMQAFPPKPDNRYSSAKTPEDQAKSRRQYLEAYRRLKAKAEHLAATTESPVQALKAMQQEVGDVIKELRGQTGSQLTAQDRYNVTANALVATLQQLTRHSKASVMGRANQFAAHYRDRYGFDPTKTTSAELHDRLADHVGDVLEGRSMLDSFQVEREGKKREFRPADLYVRHAERKGGPQVPQRTAADNLRHLTDAIGFYGVQWGNSVSDQEREHHAQKAVEAFLDLADVLGLPVSDVSQGGQLGLAIGARGHGTALAHYEPRLKMPDGSEARVINLTRKGGVGSLAHEWGHFFDNMLEGYGPDKFMSEDHRYTHEIVGQDGRTHKVPGGAVPGRGATKRELPDTPVRQAYGKWAESVQPFRRRLRDVIAHAVGDGTIPRSKAQYWASTREVFARAFERYVQRKLESQGRANTYLAGVEQHPLWPTDEEVDQMTPAFDAIFDAYRAHRHPGVERHSILAGNREARRQLHTARQVAEFAREFYASALSKGLVMQPTPEYQTSQAIEPLHGVTDREKLNAMRASMDEQGWVGRPVLARQTEDGDLIGITGSHRVKAARLSGIDVPYHPVADEEYRRIAESHGGVDKLSDEDRLEVLRQIGDEHAVSLMEQELRENEVARYSGAGEAAMSTPPDDLGHASATEHDIEFTTGKPVRFPFIHNTERAPRMGSRFGQDIEPHGRYIQYHSNPDPAGLPKNMVSGEVEFQNPLVIAHAEQDIYGPNGWKARLSRAFGGKRGKRLSQAIAAAGYDGIVTIDPKYKVSSEIVDLTMFHRPRGK